MNDELQREVTRIRNLRQNKDKDIMLLERIAQLNLWKKQIDVASRFQNTAEKKLAEEILESYISNYPGISTFNDMQNISDIVYEEVLKQKIQKDIDVIISDEKSKFVPDKMIQSLHDVQETIWKLKDKIGINKDKEKEDITALKELEEKFSTYIPFNRNEFTFWSAYKCSQCSHENIYPVLLRRRVKDFKVLKHPAFSGRFLYNIEIIEDFKKGLITKEQASRYLRTSPAYIDWCVENEHEIVEIEGVSQKLIDKFINDNPNLRDSDFYDGNKK